MQSAELWSRPGARWVPSEEELAFDMLPRSLAAIVMAILAGLVAWGNAA